MMNLPKMAELLEATLQVMIGSELGIHNKEIDSEVAKHLNLSTEQISQVRLGKRTEFAYRMAWARQRLKQEKKIENLGKGFWKII